MLKTAASAALGVAVLMVGVGWDIPAGHASYFGDARWCVMTFGDDVHWRCEFHTGEECVTAAARSRGQCNVNPYYTGSSAPAGPSRRGRRS